MKTCINKPTKKIECKTIIFNSKIMENEIWKKIEGYEKYQISSYGRVKSYNNNKRIYLKQCKNSNNGYYFVSLYKNKIRKTSYLHRLVAENFIENPENKPEVNHLNGDKSNNQVTNLDWATSSENIQHAFNTGLMENVRKNAIKAYESRQKPIYSKKLDMQFNSISEAANFVQTHYFENTELGNLQTTIGRLLNNKVTKSKYDFAWQYVITNQ